MDFSKEKILKMDDKEMERLIMEICTAAGGDERNARRLASDIPSLKKRISKMSSKDGERLVEKIGKDKAGEIMKKLNG